MNNSLSAIEVIGHGMRVNESLHKTNTGNTSKTVSKMGSPEQKLISMYPENTKSSRGLSVDDSGSVRSKCATVDGSSLQVWQ